MSAQEGFLLLVWPEPGAQARTERGLEPMHCGFCKGSAPVTVKAFPVRLAKEADGFEGTVSFDQAGFMVKDGAGPRWSYEPKSPPTRASVTAAPVIGAVADDFPGGGEVGGGQEGIEGL